MTILFLFMVILGVLLILPGWLWARKKVSQTPLILGLPIVGIVMWIGLTSLGMGAQSLSNIVEIFIVFAVSICSAYFKFIFFNRRTKHRSHGTLYAIPIVLLVTIGLRLFMPTLSE
jgi:hypothetical protein